MCSAVKEEWQGSRAGKNAAIKAYTRTAVQGFLTAALRNRGVGSASTTICSLVSPLHR